MTGCSSGIERFQETGTLYLLVRDNNLATQNTLDSSQQMNWVLESATADISGLPQTYSFMGIHPCNYVDNIFFRGDVASECGGTGIILGTETRTVTFHLAFSRMDLHRALQPALPENGDYDGDGVLNGSDNCKLIANPPDPTTGVQADVNGDGVGDACSFTDSAGGIRSDQDKDGIADEGDNCLFVPNPADPTTLVQTDTDGDSIGDACEQIVHVIIPSGELHVDCPAAFTPSNSGPTYFIVTFDDLTALSCTPSHSSCTLVPSEIKIYRSGTDPTTAQACVVAP
jgi:hypothetical protein